MYRFFMLMPEQFSSSEPRYVREKGKTVPKITPLNSFHQCNRPHIRKFDTFNNAGAAEAAYCQNELPVSCRRT